MDLFGISHGTTSSTGFTLAGSVRPAAKEPADEGTAVESPRPSMRTNIMAGNFVHSNREESRYIKGLKTGLATQNEFLNKMQSVLSDYRHLVELSGDPSYSKDAVKAVSSMVENEVKDTNTEKIEEMREDIEKKAEEAVAPESEKAMENDASPQEALKDSLKKAEPETQAKGEQAPTEGEQVVTEPETPTEGEQAVTEPETPVEPVIAADPTTGQPKVAAQTADTGQEAAARQTAPGNAPARPSINIVV